MVFKGGGDVKATMKFHVSYALSAVCVTQRFRSSDQVLPDAQTMARDEIHIFMQIGFQNQAQHFNSNGVLFLEHGISLESCC